MIIRGQPPRPPTLFFSEEEKNAHEKRKKELAATAPNPADIEAIRKKIAAEEALATDPLYTQNGEEIGAQIQGLSADDYDKFIKKLEELSNNNGAIVKLIDILKASPELKGILDLISKRVELIYKKSRILSTKKFITELIDICGFYRATKR